MSVDLNQLNSAQREAVEHREGPLLVLAGAGSGKTRVITYRTARLLECGVAASSVLVMTFTNKAASEMRQRILAMVGGSRGKELTLSTFHAFGARLLRHHVHHLGYTKRFTIIDEADRNRLLRSALRDIGLHRSGMKTDQIVRWISTAKQKRTTPASLSEARFSPLLPHAQRVFSTYQETLKALNAVDFDDLLVLPLRLLSEFEEVRADIRRRFGFVMVDEYQDTNATQLELLQAIASNGNLMAVGDDDQSIYAFRGAVAKNILEFEKHFPGTKIVTLDQNYRSTGRILDGANAVITNNRERHAKKLWSAKGEGRKIRFMSAADERKEALFVVDEIQRLHKEEGVPYHHFAVLYRINQYSKLLEEALRQGEIPYRVLGGTALFDRAEVRDWIAYLRLLVNRRDEISLRRIMNVPRRGIGPGSVKILAQAAKDAGANLWNTLETASSLPGLSSTARAGAAQLLDLVTQWSPRFRSVTGPRLAGVAASFFEATGLEKSIRGLERTPGLAQRRIQSIRVLIDGMGRDNPAETITSYVARTSLDTKELDAEQGQGNGVTLLTLHSSKGLEFPRVFIIGFEKDLLPHKKSANRPSAIAEERRLCYVGMTRAMEQLTLTTARTRLHRNERVPRQPSSFLEEIPEALLERHSVAESIEDPQREKNRLYFAKIHEMLKR